MKKIGIVFFISMIIVIVALASFTYAFFNVQKTDFELVIASGNGSVINFELTYSLTNLIPAPTNSDVDNYSVVDGEDCTYAVYGFNYRSLSAEPKDLSLYISSITYSQNAHKDYLDRIIDFTFEIEDNTFVFNENNIPTPQNTWLKKSADGNSCVKFEGIEQGTGMILCYIRLNVPDELVPEFLNNIKISFTISTKIE